MNHYFITGTSRGIGKAIAVKLLEREDNFVIGISRNCTIEHERYEHYAVDLSKEKDILEWKFPLLFNAKKIALINNAGMLGEVRYAGRMEAADISSTIQLNLVAPAVLTNAFLKTYHDHKAEQIIINVSSGAGKNPIDGWSVYCATKAGLDMHTKVVADEVKIGGRPNTWIFSVAPGVVDTFMQESIRESQVSEFSQINRFLTMKNEAQLADPEVVAQKYCTILESPEKFTDTLFSVKDIG